MPISKVIGEKIMDTNFSSILYKMSIKLVNFHVMNYFYLLYITKSKKFAKKLRKTGKFRLSNSLFIRFVKSLPLFKIK